MARLTARYENGICVDIEIKRENALPFQMLGNGGKNRELAILPKDFDQTKHLAVFLGYGMGIAFAEFRRRYPAAPLAIVDKEQDILEALNFSCPEDVLLISEHDKKEAITKLTKWQEKNQKKALYPVINPFYQRLDREYYGFLREHAAASQKFNFWDKAKYAKFQSSSPKLLLISSKYFLMGEVETACKNLKLEYRHIQLGNDEIAHSEFVRQLLEEIVSFKPDALITLNHLGVDREGVLMDLINKLELPFISWFVDNPHLILYSYEGLTSPFLHIFTWDFDNVPSLKAKGFNNVYYLPLGTDAERFNPKNKEKLVAPAWKSPVSFVGNSMIDKVQKRLDACNLPKHLYADFFALAKDFISSPKRIAEKFILDDGKQLFPALIKHYQEQFDTEEKLAFETGMTWEATRVYRLECVKQTLDFNPLLVGDHGWNVFLEKEKRPWRWHAPINYYDQLPYFYPHSTINFNCTSMQMKGASNQRILDVPATGSFVITDYREQMENMFDIGEEIICYKNNEEIPDLIRYYLNHGKEREAIVRKGRERVLKCHTWTHRMSEILSVMKEWYGRTQY
jgi:Uncharacterized protein conserved in bacteria